MKKISMLIAYYLSISIITVLLINIYCPMRQCLYSDTIEISWLVLLCIPFIYSYRFFHKKTIKLVVFFVILLSVYYYGIYSSIIFLFLTIISKSNTSQILNSIFKFIIAFVLSLIMYVFYLLYIEGVFF